MSRWKQLVPQMSYRGRTLVINGSIIPVTQVGMCRSATKPASECPGTTSGLLLAPATLDSSEYPPSAQRGKGARSGPFGLQNFCLQITVPSATPNWTQDPGMENSSLQTVIHCGRTGGRQIIIFNGHKNTGFFWITRFLLWTFKNLELNRPMGAIRYTGN